MKAGDTFLIDRAIDAHLWVIISDPDQDPEHIVMVSMTTYESHKEKVCLLDVGDHPLISHKTCIAYSKSKVVSLEHLTAFCTAGKMCPKQPVSDLVLARIREGASLSRMIIEDHLDILLSQGVLG